MEKYDIIVVGAGPAGLSFASQINNKKVLVIDRRRELGTPIKSSAGTFTDTITEFNLKDAVCHSSKGFRIILDNRQTREFVYEKPVLHTLNFKKMIEILAKRARERCQLLYPVEIKRVGIIDGIIEFLETDIGDFEADIFIDASGETRILLEHLNPHYYNKQWLIYGIECEASNLDFNPDFFDIYFGNNLIPEGYCWVFPIGNTSARIGLGKLIPGKGGRRKVNLEDALKNFIDSDIITIKNFHKGNIIDNHGGMMTYYKPLQVSYFKNCFVIGDASSQSSCLLGEGIRLSLKSGRQLAFALNCFDLAFAKEYYQKYINYLTQNFSYFISLLQYFKWAPNWGIHALVKSLSDYDNANMLRILRSEFKKFDFFRLFLKLPFNL